MGRPSYHRFESGETEAEGKLGTTFWFYHEFALPACARLLYVQKY